MNFNFKSLFGSASHIEKEPAEKNLPEEPAIVPRLSTKLMDIISWNNHQLDRDTLFTTANVKIARRIRVADTNAWLHYRGLYEPSKKCTSASITKSNGDPSNHIEFKSLSELLAMIVFDSNDQVKEWRIEPPEHVTPYIKEDGSKGRYHPDFLVVLQDGSSFIVEVKNPSLLNDQNVLAKRDAFLAANPELPYEMWEAKDNLSTVKWAKELDCDISAWTKIKNKFINDGVLPETPISTITNEEEPIMNDTKTENDESVSHTFNRVYKSRQDVEDLRQWIRNRAYSGWVRNGTTEGALSTDHANDARNTVRSIYIMTAEEVSIMREQINAKIREMISIESTLQGMPEMIGQVQKIIDVHKSNRDLLETFIDKEFDINRYKIGDHVSGVIGTVIDAYIKNFNDGVRASLKAKLV